MSDELLQSLRGAIRTLPDFPQMGIMIRDITPVLSDGGLMSGITEHFTNDLEGLGWRPEAVVGPAARGFILGPRLAATLNIPFIPVRKPGKLPADTISAEYNLEYGSNTLEMHTDALSTGQRVVIVDDLMATGGTVGACVDLCDTQGAVVVGALFVIELTGLGARENLSPVPVHALVDFPA